MNLAYLANVVFQVGVMAFTSYVVFVEPRYTIRRRRSKNWPTTAGTIDSGIVGFRGPLSGFPRVLYRLHLTYSYRVNGFSTLVDSLFSQMASWREGSFGGDLLEGLSSSNTTTANPRLRFLLVASLEP